MSLSLVVSKQGRQPGVVSATPGRVRCAVPEIHRNPALAALVERSLASAVGVTEITANHVTGRVLVLFRGGIDLNTILEYVRSAVASGAQQLGRAAPVAGVRRQRASMDLVSRPPSRARAGKRLRYGLLLPAGVLVSGWLLAGGVIKGVGWLAAGAAAGIVYASMTSRVAPAKRPPVRVRSRAKASDSDLLRPYRGRFTRAILLSAFNKVLDLSPPLFIGAALNIVAVGPLAVLTGLGFATAQSQLWALGALSILGWGLASLTEYLNKVAWRRLSQTIQHDLRTRLYNHIQHLDVSYIENHSTGELASFLQQDVDTIGRFVDTGASELVQTITSTIMISTILLVVAPGISAVAVLALPFVMVGTVFYHRYIGDLYSDVRKRSAQFAHLAANNISGIGTIKILTAETREAQRVRRESESLRTSYDRVIRIAASYSPSIRMVVTVGATYTLIAGGLLAVSGQITLGAYSIMVFLSQRLIWPIVTTGDAFDLLQHSRSGIKRIAALLNVEPEIRSGSRHMPKRVIKGRVVFDNVTFAYRDELPIFDRLCLEIREGEQIGIVGPTGAGKTTFAKLLLRFYEPSAGNIFIDDYNIRDVQISDLRTTVGLVGQENFLFYGTIRENIAFGRSDASLEAIIQAAKIAEIHDFISTLPEGYSTFVGEDGYKLSGGERQRISIARAVLRDPAILLLDEATSSVDYETEAGLKRSLARATEGRTTIIIAHRLSTVRNTHRIYVLNQGMICEAGDHDQLLAKDGLYASLWRIQTGDESRASLSK